MTNPPYFPFCVNDYKADTEHLSAIGHAAYLLLIMNYWQRQAPLPDDEDRLRRVAKLTHEQWAEVRGDVIEFFIINDGYWYHNYIEGELDKVREKSAKAKASVQKRYDRSTTVDRSKSDRSTTVVRPYCDRSTNVKNTKKTEASESENCKSAAIGGDAGKKERSPPTSPSKEKTQPKEKNTKKEKVERELSRALDAERVAAVIAHRRELKKPLTEHAAKLLANQFLKLPDPNAGADLMIERGWQGFNAEWFENANAPPGRNIHEFQPRPKSANGQMFDALKEIAENERVTIDHEPDRRAPRLIGRASNDG